MSFVARTAVLTVKSAIGTHEKKITVTQKPFVWDVLFSGSSDPWAFNPVSGGSGTIKIESSNGWKVSTPDWITASPSTESGNKTVTLTVSANTGKSQRTGSITVSSDKGGHKAVRDVVQDAFESKSESFNYPEINASEQTFEVVASGSWTTSSVPAGFTVSPSSGSGNKTVTVKALDNTSLTTRGGKFTVNYTATGGFALQREVTLSQDAFKFNSDAVTLEFDALSPGSKEFSVVCSSGWTITSTDDWSSWLTLSKPSGEGSTSGTAEVITVTPKENDMSFVARTAVLTVKSAIGTHEKKITITQKPFVWDVLFSGSSDPWAFNPVSGGSGTIKIESSNGWKVSTPDWITASPSTESGNKTVTLTVSANTGKSQRTGSITVSSDKGGHKEVRNVVQDAFESKSESFSYPEINTSDQTFEVVASGSWTTSSVPDGFTVSPSSGSGNTVVTVKALNNTSLTPRGGKFTVNYTATGGFALQREVTLSQEAFKFNSDAVTLEFDALSPGSKEFSVVCSSGWTITSTDDWSSWLTLSKPSGEGSTSGVADVITVTPQENTTDVARDVILTITSSLGGFTKTVTIHQAPGTTVD